MSENSDQEKISSDQPELNLQMADSLQLTANNWCCNCGRLHPDAAMHRLQINPKVPDALCNNCAQRHGHPLVNFPWCHSCN